jgi:hypothetical protein
MSDAFTERAAVAWRAQRERQERAARAPRIASLNPAPRPIYQDDSEPPPDMAPPIGEPVGQDDTAMVEGVEKRITTMRLLNERYAILQTPGSASAYVSRHDFQPIQDVDLKRRLAPEVVITGNVAGKPIYKSAFTVWTGSASRHVYRRVVFTSQSVAADTYNLYRGLGVTPKPGKCDRIRRHIAEVICAGDAEAADAMFKLMAWQLQNIGKPSRVVVVLKSERHQAGKGIILGEVLAKIYGPSSFVPSTMDQVLGRFNDAIRGRSLIFLDEVLFAGDRRAADSVKSLSTSSEMGIETKGLPIVNCPVAVNLWLASNHDNAAHIEEHDARYWVLNVSEHRVGDAAYFMALSEEIKNGGREAFAHHLLNLDVSNFVPWRDIKKDNQAKRDMVREGINPYDARKWLEDCCKAGRLIGRRDSEGKWSLWNEGEEYPFADLGAAYVEWQRTVKSPVAAKPTPLASLSQVLGGAGFTGRRTNSDRFRSLPSTETCLENLWKPRPGKEGDTQK